MSGNRFLFVLLMVTVACGCALAQTSTATLQGTVTDPSDAAVPGATVELKNLANGAVRTTISTSEGIFRFNAVTPGTYDMTVKSGTGSKSLFRKKSPSIPTKYETWGSSN